MALYYLNQYISKTLDTTGGIDNSQTTDIALPDVDGLEIAKPGIAILSYTSPLDTDSAEWITYTSINAVTFKFEGVTRGAEGYGAKAHAKGVTIAFPISESHINNLNDMFVTAGGGYTQIATPANPASGFNKLYFKSDDKIYKLNSAGVEAELGAGGTAAETFIIPGTLATGTDLAKTWVLPFDCKLQSATPYVKTAGTTNATTFDINLAGSTIATTKLSIASGATSGSNQSLDDPTTTRTAGSLITIDIDSVSTTAPVEAYIVLFYERV